MDFEVGFTLKFSTLFDREDEDDIAMWLKLNNIKFDVTL